MKMIQAVVKLQACTTKPGCRAFVAKDWHRHGIAAGHIRFYIVTGKNWSAIRRAVASVDTTGGRTMGYSNVNQNTVVKWEEVEVVGMSATETHAKPMSMEQQIKAIMGEQSRKSEGVAL